MKDFKLKNQCLHLVSDYYLNLVDTSDLNLCRANLPAQIQDNSLKIMAITDLGKDNPTYIPFSLTDNKRAVILNKGIS